MAAQILLEEMKGCPGYFDWMMEQIERDGEGPGQGILDGRGAGKDIRKDHEEGISGSGKLGGSVKLGGNGAGKAPLGDVAWLMFGTDFIWDEKIKEDEIRATDAMELRRRYADEMGKAHDKSGHDTDRIWKSIHGKCSVLELILSLCFRLDEMVNEDEPGIIVPVFFRLLTKNLGFVFSGKDGRISADEAAQEEWKRRIERFLKREYGADGRGGGLFPLKNPGGKDQRKVPIWYQMNAWLSENLDEEEHFIL